MSDWTRPSGLNLESPLGGASQLLSFRPGQNAADLQTSGSSLSDMLPQDGLLPKDGLMPDEGRRVARSQGAGLVPAGWSVAEQRCVRRRSG
nr:hypothetical protein GCM10020092_007200 [Actinoplanes digitatis]